MKVTIKNFQAIQNATVEVTGFTVVTGRSNLGKSSLIRSLEAVLFGKIGDFFVREGHLHTYVSYESEGLEIKWQKNRAGKQTPKRPNAININGTHYSKLGKTGHAELTEPFGIREIRTQYVRLRPQVARQHDPIFLVSEPDATVAEVFKLLGRTDVISRAQVEAKRDRLGLVQRQKVREEDEQEVKRAAEIMRSADGLGAQYSILEFGVKRKKSTVILIEVLKDKITELTELTTVNIPSVPEVKVGVQGRLVQLIGEMKMNEPMELPGVPRQPSKMLRHTEELTKIKGVLNLDQGIRTEQVLRRLLEESIERMKKEHTTMLVKMGVCPTCKQNLAKTIK